MTVKIEKKITPKVQAATSDIDAQKVANQYKKIESELKALVVENPEIKKKQDKLAALKKQLVDHSNTVAGDDEILEYVTKFGDVKVGKRGSSRSLTDKKKAIEFMTEEVFIELSEPKMSDLDKYLTPVQLEQVTVTKKTNTRRVT